MQITWTGDSETFDKKKANCRLCKVMWQSLYSGNTTNFAAHLEHHHPAEYPAFLKESGRKTSASASGSSSSMWATLQADLTRFHPSPKTSSHHKKLVNAVAWSIHYQGSPSLISVEEIGFRSLMEITQPCFAVPSVLQSDGDTFSIPAEEKQGWKKPSTGRILFRHVDWKVPESQLH